MLRPINYPEGTPGQGSIVLDTPKGKVGVINVQGRTFMKMLLENPFTVMEQAVAKMREETNVIFVDMHSETTSEKYALGWFLDGKVSAVVGTHTHVQTADERILPKAPPSSAMPACAARWIPASACRSTRRCSASRRLCLRGIMSRAVR